MDINTILKPETTFCSVDASSKKRAIEFAATAIFEALPELDVGHIYRGLLERERLGSTAIGEGVAIPHCRLPECDSIIGSLFVFNQDIDFAAPDGQAVRIMFVLLVPDAETTEHLKTLGMLAERFQDEDYRDSLLNADSKQALFEAAISPLQSAGKSGSTRG